MHTSSILQQSQTPFQQHTSQYNMQNTHAHTYTPCPKRTQYITLVTVDCQQLIIGELIGRSCMSCHMIAWQLLTTDD